MNDRYLATRLVTGGTLLWQGRPDPSAPGPGAPGCLRWAGIALLLPFAFLLYTALAHWIWMVDVRGLLIGMLGVNLFAVVMPVWGIPMLAGKGYGNTRYGVIRGHALILQGLGTSQLHCWPLSPGTAPRSEPHGPRHHRVVWGRVTRRMDLGASKVPVTTDLAFGGLTNTEASAALAALRVAWPP